MPRSMFAADGTMLHGSLKSTLMDILEKLNTGRNIEGYTKEDLHASFYKRCLIAVSSKSDNNSFFRWDGAFSLKIKTVEQWNRYCTGKLRG